MPVRVRINRAKCIVAGFCLYAAPQVFEPLDDGKPGIREEFRDGDDPSKGVIPDELIENVKRAEAMCPVRAIEIING